MKPKLLAVTVASVLGLGVVNFAQAQEQDGCQAYVTGSVVDIRLVDPNDGPDGTVVTLTEVGQAGGTNFARITNPTGAHSPGVPPDGTWDVDEGVANAAQRCIGDPGDGTATVLAMPPCEVEDTYSELARFQDFGRSDTISVPGTSALPPGVPGPPDVDYDGDDFAYVCESQRSFTPPFVVPRTSNGESTNAITAFQFRITGDTSTATLELRGDYDGTAVARVSAGTEGGSAQAITGTNFRIQRLSDLATLECDTRELEGTLTAERFGVGQEGPNVFSADAIICDAADFGVGSTTFDPGEIYDISAEIGCQATCNLAQRTNGDGFKWYLAKRIDSPRLPNPIVEDLVITDQFGTQTVDVRQLVELLNPAVKNPEPDEVPQDSNHLTCYNLRRVSDAVIVPGNVRITTDNFGVEDVRLTRGPKELCGPAIKNGESGPDTTYYTCYAANGGQNQGGVTITDQFFTERQHQLEAMSRVCTPAGLNGASPPPPTDRDHLACYEFASQPRLPRQDPFLPNVDDPFIPDPGVTVTVEREQRWCERADKEVL